MSTDLSYAPYIMALTSAILYSLSSIIFTNFSRRISSLWMNVVKAWVAIPGFFIMTHFFYGWHSISNVSLVGFLVSGILGLACADVLFFLAFAAIGPARTLMLFGFAPLINGVLAYFAFGQEIDNQKFLAIIFLVCCLVVFSYERYKQSGKWEIHGLVYALLGVCIDCVGICLTRFAFDQSPEVHPLEANFYRCAGALFAFFVITRFRPIELIGNFKKLSISDRGLAVWGGVMGTFLSLWLFLSAVQIGHLATVSAISVTAPFLATLFETVFYKKKPTKYLFLAALFFLCGFGILLN